MGIIQRLKLKWWMWWTIQRKPAVVHGSDCPVGQTRSSTHWFDGCKCEAE